MPIFPFYPNYYNNYYPRYRSNYYNNKAFQNSNITQNSNRNENQEEKEDKIEEKQHGQESLEGEIIESRSYDKTKEKRTSKYNSFANINISAILETDLNTPVIEILGIKLYLDDLIIIGLLFFLYKEDVQDEILFGILLMLLLS